MDFTKENENININLDEDKEWIEQPWILDDTINWLWDNMNSDEDTEIEDDKDEWSDIESLEDIINWLYDKNLKLVIKLDYIEEDDKFVLTWNWKEFLINWKINWFQEQINEITITWYTFEQIQEILLEYSWTFHILHILTTIKNSLKELYSEKTQRRNEIIKKNRLRKKTEKVKKDLERLEKEERELKKKKKEKARLLKEILTEEDD